LCVLRAICGLGLAVASPAGFGIVGVTFKYEPERTVAFAAFGLGAPLGAACGTLIGGAIAATGEQVIAAYKDVSLIRSRGWTYLFYLLGGIAVIPIVIGLLVIPKDDRSLRQVDEDRRIDWIGGFIVTAGLCLFCFSLTESGIAENGWATPCMSKRRKKPIVNS
jgi:MFS family permease